MTEPEQDKPKKLYKDRYTKIDKRTIEAVRNAILTQRFYKQDNSNKKQIITELFNRLNAIYNTQATLRIDENNNNMYMMTGGGMYNPSNNTIHLFKLSLITFLHEFKHALLKAKGKKQSEIQARGYSISLFYKASERHYNRAVRKGLIFHEKP